MAPGEATATDFRDRAEVGDRLARLLRPHREPGAIVLALPRGGVVVGARIAEALDLPLEVLVLRKIGHPADPEYGLGAVVEELPPVLDPHRLLRAGLAEGDLAGTIRIERQEVERRVRRYRGGRLLADIRGKTVLLVDDGIATGGTIRAALQALKARRPRRIVLAVGVAPPETFALLRPEVDELYCLSLPTEFTSVGAAFERFDPVPDDEVVALLRRFGNPETRP